MRCENCAYFIKKLKCSITGDSMSRYERMIEPLNREIQPEIIRCKDCKYWRIDSEGERYCDRIVGVLGCDDGNGYCSDAERR
jgi:hypothetical protein